MSLSVLPPIAYTIVEVAHLAGPALLLTLQADDDVRWQAGKYINLGLSIHGRFVARSFSLTQPPGGPLQILVKRVENGELTRHLMAVADVGLTLYGYPPAGAFTLVREGLQIVVGAGSGIAPIHALAMETARSKENVVVVQAAPDEAQAYFSEDFTDLVKSKKIAYWPYLSRTKHNAQRLRADALIDRLVDSYGSSTLQTAHAYLCGPWPLMRSLRIALIYAGVPAANIKTEYFEAPPLAEAPIVQPGLPSYTAIYNQTKYRLAPGKTVLDGALHAGLALPYSCRGGVCGTCQAKLLDGKIAMRINEFLSDADVAAGSFLTCTALPMSEEIAFSIQ